MKRGDEKRKYIVLDRPQAFGSAFHLYFNFDSNHILDVFTQPLLPAKNSEWIIGEQNERQEKRLCLPFNTSGVFEELDKNPNNCWFLAKNFQSEFGYYIEKYWEQKTCFNRWLQTIVVGKAWMRRFLCDKHFARLVSRQ